MNRNLHFIFSIAITTALSFWFFSQVLVESYPDKSPYKGVEIRFDNTQGVRTSDYIARIDSNSFLLATGAPNLLRLRMEFLGTGDFTAVISAQYPHWLCTQRQFDRGQLKISGGSLNESVKLIRSKPTEVDFSISKGQSLKFRVKNKNESECGRAIIKFYEKNNYTYFTLLFLIVWGLVFLLCWLNNASPYIAMLGTISSFLFITSSGTIQTFGTSSLVFNTISGLPIAGALLLFSVIPLQSKSITLFFKVLLVFVLLIPITLITYNHVFGVPLDAEAIHGAMQSYDSQMIEFWKQFIGKRRTVYLILMLVALYACLRHINFSKPKVMSSFTCGALILSISLLTLNGRINDSSIINLLTRSIIEYKWEIEAFRKVSAARKLSTTTAARDQLYKNNTTVIVIGESVNKKHMSAYGYPRETTPLLNRRITEGTVVKFNRAYSNHTHSNPTMSLILTQANQYNERSWLGSPSVFNYARSANVETHWLTNHRLLGGWSNQITTIIKEADRLKTINYKIGYGLRSSNYDHDLIPLYKDALKEHKNQLTFLHLYNSHSHYCNRYPESASILQPDTPESHFGNLKKLQTFSLRGISCYDNTILYTDGILDELIHELEKNTEPSVLLYFADHAEEPIAGRTHNSAMFTFDMINIPLVIWANKAWQQQHPKSWNNLQANKDKVVTNDLMFESILGLAGIKDSSINTKFDITSANYRSLENPLTLHGRVKINHPENWNYWQSKNSLSAVQNNFEIVASNIYSIGEGRAALQYGITKLQIDIKYSPEYGIELSNVDSLGLSSFLESLDAKTLTTLFVNVADKTSNNEAKVTEQLSEIEDKYQIKIIKINGKPNDIKELSSPGLFTQIKSVSQSKPIWVNIKTRYRNTAPVKNAVPDVK